MNKSYEIIQKDDRSMWVLLNPTKRTIKVDGNYYRLQFPSTLFRITYSNVDNNLFYIQAELTFDRNEKPVLSMRHSPFVVFLKEVNHCTINETWLPPLPNHVAGYTCMPPIHGSFDSLNELAEAIINKYFNSELLLY
jgi:hypothetical protein